MIAYSLPFVRYVGSQFYDALCLCFAFGNSVFRPLALSSIPTCFVMFKISSHVRGLVISHSLAFAPERLFMCILN
jgi:hypothetical protein